MARQHLPPRTDAAALDEPHDLIDATSAEESVTDPKDYSAIGGPDSEAAYGRSRAVAGEYPFNEHGGSYDRDELSHPERGGIMTNRRVEKRT